MSKRWKKTVNESAILWRKVYMLRKWSGGSGFLVRVIGLAEEVSFSRVFINDEKHVMSIGRLLGPNLECLTPPSESVFPTFHPVLFFKCSQLESLVAEGFASKGNDLVRISHSKLETHSFYASTPLRVTIDCPSLFSTTILTRGTQVL